MNSGMTLDFDEENFKGMFHLQQTDGTSGTWAIPMEQEEEGSIDWNSWMSQCVPALIVQTRFVSCAVLPKIPPGGIFVPGTTWNL